MISFEALVSFDSKVLTACPGSDQLIHSTDLVVDLRWLASFVICASVTARKGGDSAAGSPPLPCYDFIPVRPSNSSRSGQLSSAVFSVLSCQWFEALAAIARPYSKSSLERPAKSIDAFKANRCRDAFQAVAWVGKMLLCLCEAKFFHEMSWRGSEDLSKETAKMPSGATGALSQSVNSDLFV